MAAQSTNPKKPFRVLSLDGGGMRGLYTASLIDHLSGQLYKGSGQPDIGKGFDLIVGTSTGGLLACALAYGTAVGKIIDLYCEQGEKIFIDPLPGSGIGRIGWAIKNWNKAANKDAVLRAALDALFDDATMGQVYEKRQIAFCIPSVKMLNEAARVFKTAHNAEKSMDDNLRLVDVCMATSAAPMFLPLVEIQQNNDTEGVYADGGLWANNPVLVGLLESLTMTTADQEIQILSVGTCGAPPGSHILQEQLSRGVFGWGVGTGALSVSMNAQASGSNYMARFFQNELVKLGKKVHIIRLPQGPVSAQHIRFLEMDLASKTALKVFKELGRTDATTVLSNCQTPTTEDGAIIKDILEKLPELKTEEQKEDV